MFDAKLLKGKNIIVTGGGTGLGKSMATRFAELGANLVITSRREGVISEAAKELQKSGGKVVAIPCDVRDPEKVEAMVEQTVKELGSVDILLNNAAGNFISPTENLSPNAFKTVIDIVLNGTFHCTQAAGKVMRKNKSGIILNIVTTYAWTGSGYVVPSACAKAGVLAMTRSLAVEWAKYGIRTVAIAPGPFPTKGAWERLNPGDNNDDGMMSTVPLGRVGDMIELQNLATFLMADGCDYLTGQTIGIDGAQYLTGGGTFSQLDKLSDDDWENMRKLIREANNKDKADRA